MNIVLAYDLITFGLGEFLASVTFITAGTISATGFALLVLMLEDAVVVEVVVEVILVVDGDALVDVVEVTKLMVKSTTFILQALSLKVLVTILIHKLCYKLCHQNQDVTNIVLSFYL